MHRADGLSVQPSPWREAAPHGRLPLERVDFLRGVHPQDLGRLEQLLPPVSWYTRAMLLSDSAMLRRSPMRRRIASAIPTPTIRWAWILVSSTPTPHAVR